jgi:hypothetical protein
LASVGIDAEGSLSTEAVIPAEAGIHVDPASINRKSKMDSRFRGNDAIFYCALVP